MMSQEFSTLPEDLKPERIGSTAPIGQETGSMQAPPSFASYMESKGGVSQVPAPGMQSPFDLLLQGHPSVSGPSNIQTILMQTKSAQTTLGDINSQLNTPNLKLRQSQRHLLKNKLSGANAYLRSANMKLGNPEIPPTEAPRDGGPLGKFLSYVTDGQNQLQAAKGALESLKDKGDSINPADLLLIQLKLNKAQQELEYSSVLLSKAVDDIKTLFSIQIS